MTSYMKVRANRHHRNIGVSGYWVHTFNFNIGVGILGCRNIVVSEYCGVEIVGSLATNFNGRNIIGLSAYWAVGILIGLDVGILGCRNWVQCLIVYPYTL